MRTFLYFIVSIFLLGCKPDKDYSLTIIHTNDLHSHLLPFNGYKDCAIDDNKCLGGFARIISFMKGEKKKNPDTLFLEAGDRFTGTAFYSLTKSRFLLPLFQMMPYDAATLGNHEFDDNLEETISFISRWKVPIVAANIKSSPAEKLHTYVRPSIIIERNNQKIGIIGVTTPEINILGGARIKIEPVKKSVAKEVQKLKAQGIKIIIVLSHIGLAADKKLAQAVPDIDVIVGGHSHSLLINDLNNPLRQAGYPIVVNNERTLIVSCGIGGQYIGKLNIKFDKDGNIISYSGDSIAVSANIPSDLKALKIISQATDKLQQILNEKIAELPVSYGYTKSTNYCSEECPVGEFITYLLSKEFPNIDGVAVNAGAIRSALAKGNIYYSNLLDLYPYDSPAVLITMSGKELKQYLRHGITHYHKHGKTNELLQTFGISYEFTTDDKQISNIIIKEQPLDLQKQYTILVPLFLANGGDRYPVKPYTDTGLTMREIMLKQLKNSNDLSYIMKHNVRIFKKS